MCVCACVCSSTGKRLKWQVLPQQGKNRVAFSREQLTQTVSNHGRNKKNTPTHKSSLRCVHWSRINKTPFYTLTRAAAAYFHTISCDPQSFFLRESSAVFVKVNLHSALPSGSGSLGWQAHTHARTHTRARAHTHSSPSLMDKSCFHKTGCDRHSLKQTFHSVLSVAPSTTTPTINTRLFSPQPTHKKPSRVMN